MLASMQRAGLAGPCSLGVGALAQEGPGVRPRPASFPSQTLDRGFLLQKIQNKNDKIKVICIWEVESELPTGILALGLHHFCCSLGQCKRPVWCEPRLYHHPHSKASALHSMLPEPSLTPSQPG
jgi:hypothetical protein